MGCTGPPRHVANGRYRVAHDGSKNGVCALPELQNMPRAPTSAELRYETVASDVTVARRSSRKVHYPLQGYRAMQSL
jgi:hypothetical protein